MNMESADGDDDLFVVIVGDDDQDYSAVRSYHEFSIEQEVNDEDTSELAARSKNSPWLAVENLIETAEKYGQAIPVNIVKQEPNDVQDQNLEPQEENLEPQEDYLEAQDGFESTENYEEYVPDSNECSEEEYLEVNAEGFEKRCFKKKESHRFKMRSLDEQQSFVKELCEAYPELKEDQELLVETLGRIMLEIKRPDPPQDYFIMNNVLFECVECGAMSETIPAATRHWQEKHGPRYLICFACGVDFRSTTNLYKHEKRCNAPDATIVLKARARTLGSKGRSRPFLADSSLVIRKIKPEVKRKFPCTQCTAVFLSKQSLRSHELKHLGARPYRCAECPAAYTSACGLSRHRARHSDQRFMCDECGRAFRSKAALVVHLDTHKPLRKYPCEECGRRFAQKMALQLHVRREHRLLPPPCACQVCPKRFPRMSILKNHMLKEHGLNLITRKMFYKSLPMLSHTQLQQAKVVLKSELENTVQPVPEDNLKSEPDLSLEHVNNYWKLREGINDDDAKLIVIQNGEAVCNIELFKNMLEDVKQEWYD